MRFKNLAGQRFGKLIVQYEIPKRKNGRIVWHCLCDCGNEKDVQSDRLTGSRTKSCGCLLKDILIARNKKLGKIYGGMNFIDLTGKRFGRLLVIKRAENYKKLSGKTSTTWVCRCDCGEEKVIRGTDLKMGRSTSCGCYNREIAPLKTFKDLTNKRFGKLIVIKRVPIPENGHKNNSYWLCKCDCGKEKVVKGVSLKNSNTKSCGCLLESFIALEIKNYLKNIYDIKEEYKIFKNPKTKRYLPYDVYIPRGNNSEINGIYIEINGNQHYCLNKWHESYAYKKGTTPEKEFEYQKYKDKLKIKFARKNGIYIEIDLRKIKTLEQAKEYIEKIFKNYNLVKMEME